MVFFCILVHDYTLYFIGSPCRNVSYYNYISITHYYIVINLIITGDLLYFYLVTTNISLTAIVAELYNL